VLGFFATFLKKGSAKNFQTGEISNNIVRSTIKQLMLALHIKGFSLRRGSCVAGGEV
jgi:hypothetical protein